MPAALTARKLDTLKPAKTRKEIPDGYLPGLYLVLQPSGSTSWAVRYRHHGHTRKHTLGKYPALDLKAARELGAKALRTVAEGRDPGREKRRTAAPIKSGTVEHLAEDFISRHVKRRLRPKSAIETERILRKHVLPAWRGFLAAEITRADVRALIDAMGDETPTMANRVYKTTRRLFSWAVENDLVTASPCEGLRAPFPETPRDRVLNDTELSLVWKGADTLGGSYGAFIKLLALTGQRRSEVAGLPWEELDLEHDLIWTLPAPRIKNKKTHIVPLSTLAVDLLRAQPRTGPYVLNGAGPLTAFAEIKRAIDALLPANIARWTFHDLRRSYASGLARLGVDLPVIERALNHHSGSFKGVVGIYQRHDFQIKVRAAMELWANHIRALADGNGRVVALGKRR